MPGPRDDSPPASSARVERAPFGQTPAGAPATVYRVANANGMAMRVTDYGGTILSLTAPDAEGTMEDVVLGFDALDDYLSDAYREADPYFGALIGRYANRIADARFALGGETYELAANDAPNHMHGGDQGFDRRLWDAEPFQDESGAGVRLRYTSPDGEEGYPGRLDVQVTYTLTDDDALAVDYEASASAATPVNLTQHSYFNLRGERAADSVLDHQLWIDAAAFTPVGGTCIPTGERRDVAGTPFDFRTPTRIGARIDADDPQLAHGQGYDHNFILRREGAAEGAGDDALALAAQVWEPESGRLLRVRTTEPGLQFYSGNSLDGTLTGKSGRPYRRRCALALETQHFPNTPNTPSFPSTLLRPGQTYRSRTVFAFSAQPSAPAPPSA